MCAMLLRTFNFRNWPTKAISALDVKLHSPCSMPLHYSIHSGMHSFVPKDVILRSSITTLTRIKVCIYQISRENDASIIVSKPTETGKGQKMQRFNASSERIVSLLKKTDEMILPKYVSRAIIVTLFSSS